MSKYKLTVQFAQSGLYIGSTYFQWSKNSFSRLVSLINFFKKIQLIFHDFPRVIESELDEFLR